MSTTPGDHAMVVSSYSRPRHRKGTQVTCQCGWRDETPVAPSQGGTREMKQAHRDHVRETRLREALGPEGDGRW